MTTVTLNMKDELNGTNVSRTIDGSNLINWSTQKMYQTESTQREMLEEWINERGNEQHDTLLSLIDWTINKN